MNPIEPGQQVGSQDQTDHAFAKPREDELAKRGGPDAERLLSDPRRTAAPGTADRIAYDRELAQAQGAGGAVKPPDTGSESASGASGALGANDRARSPYDAPPAPGFPAAAAPVPERPEVAVEDVRQRTSDLFDRIRDDVHRAGRLGTALLAIALGSSEAAVDPELRSAAPTLLAHVPPSGPAAEELATFMATALTKPRGQTAPQVSAAVEDGLAHALLNLRMKLDAS